jgi:hypothetical protein
VPVKPSSGTAAWFRTILRKIILITVRSYRQPQQWSCKARKKCRPAPIPPCPPVLFISPLQSKSRQRIFTVSTKCCRPFSHAYLLRACHFETKFSFHFYRNFNLQVVMKSSQLLGIQKPTSQSMAKPCFGKWGSSNLPLPATGSRH